MPPKPLKVVTFVSTQLAFEADLEGVGCLEVRQHIDRVTADLVGTKRVRAGWACMKSEQHVDRAGQKLLDLDHKVHKAVKKSRFTIGVKLIAKLSDVSDQPQMRLLCAGTIALGLVRKDARMIIAGARMLLAHEVATIAKTVIKDRVDRTRPRSAADKEDEKPQPGKDKGKEESSFPSGHSAGAMAVASAFAAVYPERALPAMLAAGAAALAQIPRCAHYPTDVGAGLVVGAAANGVVGLAWRIVRSAARIVVRQT